MGGRVPDLDYSIEIKVTGVISTWDRMSSGVNFARGRRARGGMRKGKVVKDGKL